jgi:hypothetical protein
MDDLTESSIKAAELLTQHFLTGAPPNYQLDERLLATFGDSMVEPMEFSTRFGAQLEHLNKAGIYVPAFGNDSDTIAPVLLGSQWWTYEDTPKQELQILFAREVPPLIEIAGRSEIKLTELTPRDAADLYRDGVAEFLQAAAEAYYLVPAGAAGGVPPTGLVRCEVHTTTHGLALRYMPRFCDPEEWTAFPGDRLTTPVQGEILPGAYKFAAEGPDYPFKKVDTVFRINRGDMRIDLPTI